MRVAVDDLASRQLPVGQADLRGAEPEPRGEAIVKVLKALSLVRRYVREERTHPIRLPALEGLER